MKATCPHGVVWFRPCLDCGGFVNLQEFLELYDKVAIFQDASIFPGFLGEQEVEFRGRPHIWVQWKGTDVCCELRCQCGFDGHYDGDFLYFWRCPDCKTVWEVGTYVALKERKADDPELKGVFIKDPDFDY